MLSVTPFFMHRTKLKLKTRRWIS